ncbi:MAG: glycosyltransferase family 2 protein [Sphingobacteriaceae bacterium]|nr:glycosyltransferase family 2 protein [Sphingobacteriaceae bacterium]
MNLPASDIRIVVPVYNSSNTICDCVDAILKAIAFCKSWELVVVDNEENSNLEILLKNYPIALIKRTDSKSAAYARNEGAKGFSNGILVFIDSDVIVETPCIERLVQPIISKSCDATIGNYSSNLNNLSFAQKYKQLYIRHIYDRNSNGIRNDFWTAIAAVDAVAFSKLNGFDIKFKGANGEDQEFGIRLTKNNFKVLAVKSANGQHRNPYSVSGIIKK